MAKKYKILISVFVTIFAVIAVIFTAINLARYAPVKYLSEKYGIDKKEFKCVEYSPKHYYLDFDKLGQGWSTPMWIYKYDNKKFIVKKIDNVYYDDFQYDEYRNWCIDFLDSILDENVVSINSNSLDFFKDNKKLSNKDFKNMLFSKDYQTIYITFDDIKPYLNDENLAFQVGEKIKKSIKEAELHFEVGVRIYDKSIKETKSITFTDSHHTYMSMYDSNISTQDVGRILRTFKIKKNVEVTDNGKIII